MSGGAAASSVANVAAQQGQSASGTSPTSAGNAFTGRSSAYVPTYGIEAARNNLAAGNMDTAYQQPSLQQNVQNMGLQAIYQNMLGQIAPLQQGNWLNQFYQQPAQQAQMPTYKASALQYQPNRAPAQASLNRVAKSVILQQKEAAEAELAKMKAEAEEAKKNEGNGWYTGMASGDSNG